jgi:hypothetical protein
MAIFAVTLTVTLYAVTDMEYPRLGLIRIEDISITFSSMLTSKCGDVGAIETSVLGRRGTILICPASTRRDIVI